jgi:hypothetical protein
MLSGWSTYGKLACPYLICWIYFIICIAIIIE